MTRTRAQRLETAAFAVLATVAVVLLGFLGAVLAGVVPVSDPAETTAEEMPAAPTATTVTVTETRAKTETEAKAPATTEPTTSPAAPNAARPAVVTLVASRGDCWVVARRGGPEGEVLHEALVPAGERVTLRAPRVWLQLGAAANVDVVVDGDPVAIGAGTIEVVLPAAGTAPS